MAVVLIVSAAAAVVGSAVVRDPWLLRGSVAALAVVAVVNALLLRRMRSILRRAQVQVAGSASALARSETRAGRELLARDHEIGRLSGELDVASARLVEVTGASLYAATVLAELLRNNTLMTTDTDIVDATATAESDDDAEDVANKAASSTVVQVWPSIDDAPTVVDLLRWDQVRRLTDEPLAEGQRPA